MPIKEYDPEELQKTLHSESDAAAPTSAPSGNFIQRGFDKLTNITPEQEAGHGALVNKAQEFGAGAIQGFGSPIIHPMNTLVGLGKSIAHPIDTAQATSDYAMEHPAQALGNLVGGVDLAGVAGPVLSSIKNKAGIGSIYPKSSNLSTEEIGARGLTKALQIPKVAQKSFIPAATQEAGTILDYAKRNTLPITGTADWAKAAEGAAKEIQDFYNENVSKPNADKPMSVAGANFRGRTFGEGPNTTIGEVEKRIATINKELNPNYRKGLQSQTNAANVSDADLQAEHNALVGRLHNALAEATGTTPEVISDLRTRAGKIRTIADESRLADAGNLESSGSKSGSGTLLPSSLSGLIDKGVNMVMGDAEIRGNRALNKSLGNLVPRSTPFPDINPPTPQPTFRQGLLNKEFAKSASRYLPERK